MIGIVGYGAYIPKYRITVEEIAKTWRKDAEGISSSLNVKEKAVAGFDEDSCTIAVEAARKAVKMAGIDAQKIGAVYVGSESHPYAVKPTASVVADAINAGPELTAADLEFACKAGTAGIQMCMGLVASSMPDWIDYGLAIGSDTAQGRPGDALEYTAASGGAAFIIGKNEKELIASIDQTFSYTTDTPDFWRRQHAEFPRHAGRFTGEPAYFRHVVSAAEGLMAKAKMKPVDFDFAVFHQPNGKFPLRVSKMLGIDPKRAKQGLLTPEIGNTYSGATMIGLASVLDAAKPGQKILAVSYGSGAGSDAFALTVKKGIEKKRPCKKVLEMVKEKEYISYAEYAKFRRKLKTL
ncbi:MAG: hydroxymethylglutaryl-CoA synthase [Candidatus Diapherotrites archaeon]|uniref:Hydroxymethylglutaryl-CoA synthase n=1 Tax=Candidatus Iainarchaeum sp. TaxID=3101447 RepID=A0A938YSU3_9ARCH|nr:hydroxymethylglutaryl-CoA synthase [Candidatus Diapherotrites archaeon]